MSKHTPTPWTGIRDYEAERNRGPYAPDTPIYMGVQMREAGGFVLHKDANRHANAAFIVKAVNEYQGLVDALQKATDQLENAVMGNSIDPKTVNEILEREVLAKAGAA